MNKLFVCLLLASAAVLPRAEIIPVDTYDYDIVYKTTNTTSQMDYYDVNGEEKTFTSRDTYTRNKDLSVKSVLTSIYNDVTKELEKDFIFEFSYDSNGNLTKKEGFNYKNDSWVINKKIEYEYDENNNLLSEVQSKVSSENVYKKQYEFNCTYNDNNLIITQKKYFYSDSVKTLDTEFEYEYNIDNQIIRESRKFQSGSSCIIEYSYNEDGKLNEEIIKGYGDYAFEYLDSQKLITYDYSGDVITKITKEYDLVHEVYSYKDKTVITSNKYIYDVKRYDYNQESWEFSSGNSVSYEYKNNKLITARTGVYVNENTLNVFEEVDYGNLNISSGSPVGIIIICVVVLFIFIFCGLFFIWKKEFDQANKDGDKNDRKLKVFDFVYRPINRVLFGKNKEPVKA